MNLRWAVEVAADEEHSADSSHITGENVDFKAVARVSTRVQLSAIRLTQHQAALFISAAEIPSDWSSRATIAFDTHADPNVDGETLVARCEFIAVFLRGLDGAELADFPSREEQDPELHIHAAFELAYAVAPGEEIDSADAEHFAFANATLHAWPYWRELAHSTTGRMGIAPLIIGTYKIPSVHDPDRQPPASED